MDKQSHGVSWELSVDICSKTWGINQSEGYKATFKSECSQESGVLNNCEMKEIDYQECS